MVIVPERAGPTFAVTLKPTCPSPPPLDPEAMAIHGAWLEAVQLQPDGAATATVAEPVLAPIDATPGLIEYEQRGCGACGGSGCSAPSA